MSTLIATSDLREQLGARQASALLAKTVAPLLADFSLPPVKSEEYRFLPITRHLEKHFSATQLISAAPSTLGASESWLGAQAIAVTVRNGRVIGIYGGHPDVVVLPLSEARKSHAHQVDTVLGQLSWNDPFSVLNAAVAQEGVFVWVHAGKQIPVPIHIQHVHEANEAGASHVRVAALVEAGAEVTVLEEFVSTGKAPFFQTQVVEIDCHAESRLHYFRLQNDHGNVTQVANTLIRQADKSTVNACTITLDGEIIRNNFAIAVNGEHCESNFHGLYLLNGKTMADNHTVVDHQKPHSHSNELYKGIMDGQSRGIFNGKIFVRPHAQKTNAFQSNRNILLSDQAIVNTKPQLEIWADDVKCSHGCTSGQLDEEALFYLQSRGIDKKSAQAMLLYAFAADVFRIIEHESIRQYVDTLITQRLYPTA